MVNFTTKAGKTQATPWLINTKNKEKLRLETINEELSCETKTMHLNHFPGWYMATNAVQNDYVLCFPGFHQFLNLFCLS